MVLAIAFQILAPLGQAISLPLASGPRPLIICTGSGLGVLPTSDPATGTNRANAPWSCPVCSSVNIAGAPLPPPTPGLPEPMGVSQSTGWTVATLPESAGRRPTAWPRAPPLLASV
jgi:hypothetical protein